MTGNDLGPNPGFFDLVGQIRAMRRLHPDPIPLGLLRRVLQAGVQAPSGMNTQPWSFVAIHGDEGRAWFAKHYKEGIQSRFGGGDMAAAAEGDSPMARQLRALLYQTEHMQEFPVILLVCGKRDWPFKVPPEERVGLAPPNYGAVYPCVQNILLACRAVGLGAALTTMHQVFEDALHERFAIPTEYGVVVAMPIGWPMGNFGSVTRRPAEEVTYFDAWGNKETSDWREP